MLLWGQPQSGASSQRDELRPEVQLLVQKQQDSEGLERTGARTPLPDGAFRAQAGRQQVVAVVEYAVVAAAVPDPQVRHTGDTARHTQQVLPVETVLVGDEQALVGRLALLLVELSQDNASSLLQLRLGVGFVVGTGLDYIFLGE